MNGVANAMFPLGSAIKEGTDRQESLKISLPQHLNTLGTQDELTMSRSRCLKMQTELEIQSMQIE